jgi:hypothetical protein
MKQNDPKPGSVLLSIGEDNLGYPGEPILGCTVDRDSLSSELEGRGKGMYCRALTFAYFTRFFHLDGQGMKWRSNNRWSRSTKQTRFLKWGSVSGYIARDSFSIANSLWTGRPRTAIGRWSSPKVPMRDRYQVLSVRNRF